MPRNSSGTYTLPAGNPVAANTIIETAWANPTMSDLGTALTESLDRFGRGSMLAAIKGIDGTAAAPMYSFSAEATTGMYRAGANSLGFTVAGLSAMTIAAAAITFIKPVTLSTSVISVNTTTPALRITQAGTGHALLVEDNTNPDATPFLIDETGVVVIGSDTVRTVNALTPKVQTQGTSTSGTAFSQTMTNASSSGPLHLFAKSRSGVLGTFGIVSNADILGGFSAYGDDGVDFQQAAQIRVRVDAVPAAGSMPGRIEFMTTPATTVAPVEAMRLDSAGRLVMSETGTAAQSTRVSSTAITPTLQINSTGALGPGAIGQFMWGTSATQTPYHLFARSKSATIGNHAAVAAADVLGRISFAGADGTQMVEAARISVSVDGAVAANQVPGSLTFSVANSAGALQNNLFIDGTGVQIAGQAMFGNGTEPLPSITFTSDPDTGMYRFGTNQIGFSTAGTLALQLGTVVTSHVQHRFIDGTAAAPSITFSSDTNTGLYSAGADIIGFSTAGTILARMNATGMEIINGTAASPAYSFINDPDCGMYRIGTNTFGFASNGAEVFRFSSAAATLAAGVFLTAPDNRFVSANQTVTTATVTRTVAHGGPRIPDLFWWVIKCTTAEHGWAVNDEIVINNDIGSTTRQYQMTANATNCILQYVTSGGDPPVIRSTTGALVNVTPASWRWVARAVWL